MNYVTKASLYEKVHNCKTYLDLPDDEAVVDLVKRCNDMGIVVCDADFNTRGLRGIAFTGDSSIVLNSNRNEIEQSFDCGHELMHLYLHSGYKREVFKCFDKMHPIQDKFVEWQANEGAAEFFIPYKTLLPIIKHRYSWLRTSIDIKALKCELEDMFQVTASVVEFRLESLKFEIHQYINGVSLDNVRVLSASQQKRQGITVSSLNQIEREKEASEYIAEFGSGFINFEAIYL